MEADILVEHGEPVRQFSVLLSNTVGSLAALFKLLHNASVDVIGLSMQDSRDATVARLIVSAPDTAEQLFRVRERILQRMPDQIGIAQSEKMFCRRIEIGDS